MESASFLYSVCIWKGFENCNMLVKCSDSSVLHWGLFHCSSLFIRLFIILSDNTWDAWEVGMGANSLKVWKIFGKTLRGLCSNTHRLQMRMLKWRVLFMVPLGCCFWQKKKLEDWWPLYQWFQNEKYLNFLRLFKNVNSPYLEIFHT